MRENIETVRSFASEMEAHLARSRLGQEGIAATVHRFSRYRSMAGGGYLLKVDVHDKARAEQILEVAEAPIDMDEYVDPDDDAYPRCPKCRSVNVAIRPLSFRQTIAVAATFGIFLMLMKRDRKCAKCGHRWRA